MSYSDGRAAMNLEMTERVPRTEYSAECHWELVKAVTGISVFLESAPDLKRNASKAFIKAWNYDFIWSTLIGDNYLKGTRTRMGHAVYAAGGVDFDTRIECPFKNTDEVLSFDPASFFGTIDKHKAAKDFEEHYRTNCEFAPDAVNMTGIYISVVSGLIALFGWEMLLAAAGEDPEGFGNVTARYAGWIYQYIEALADSDVPIVMVHDDIVWTSGPFIHPDWYRRFVFPHYKKFFRILRESGKKIIFTSDGNYSVFIDDIAECGVHGFVLEPLTNMGYIAEKYGKTHVFIGNADTRILLYGSRQDIEAEVKRCMDIGKKYAGFFMAVGNHIPPNTPVASALYYNEVYEKLSRR